jgi:outer membrane protein insertion porin family
LGPDGLPDGSINADISKSDGNGNATLIDCASCTTVRTAYVLQDGEVVTVSVPVGKTTDTVLDSSGQTVTALYIPVVPRALGGNMLMEFSTELIFPLPFIEDQRSVRSYLYYDIGNVFTDQCLAENPNCENGIDLDELRSAVGVGLTWVTGIGPLTFTYSKPLNDKEGDDTEGFEFSLGQTF